MRLPTRVKRDICILYRHVAKGHRSSEPITTIILQVLITFTFISYQY